MATPLFLRPAVPKLFAKQKAKDGVDTLVLEAKKCSRKEVIHRQIPLATPCSCFSSSFEWHGLYLHPP